LISGILFTANNFLIKQFNVVISDLLIVRSVLQITILSTFIYCSGEKLWQERKQLNVLTIVQGIAGSISVTSVLISISFIPLPDVLCIALLYPLATVFLTQILIRNALTSLPYSSFTLLVLGTFLVSQPSFLFPSSPWPPSPMLTSQPGMYTAGVVLACLAFIAWGGMTVGVERCQSVPVPVLALWTAIFSLPMAIFMNLLQPGSCVLSSCITLISSTTWLILIGLSLSGFLAFLLLIQAMKMISPTICSSLSILEIVLAYTSQLILSKTYPELLTCVGMMVVVVGVITITLHDQSVSRWTTVRVIRQPEHQPLIPDRGRRENHNVSYTNIQ